MALHPNTFEYLKPTVEQIETMAFVRRNFMIFAQLLDKALPEGPDKTYILRKLREIAMWSNISVTRMADGAPRSEPEPEIDIGDPALD